MKFIYIADGTYRLARNRSKLQNSVSAATKSQTQKHTETEWAIKLNKKQ